MERHPRLQPSAGEGPENSTPWAFMQQANVCARDGPPLNDHDTRQPDSTLSLYPYSSRTQSYSEPSGPRHTFSLPDMNEDDSLSLIQSESVQPPPKGITLDLTMSIGTPG